MNKKINNKHKIEKIKRLKNKLSKSIEKVQMAYEKYEEEFGNFKNASKNMEIYEKKINVVRAYEKIRSYYIEMAISCANPETETDFENNAKKEFTNLFDCRMFRNYFKSEDCDAFGYLSMGTCLNIDCDNLTLPFKANCTKHECHSIDCISERQEGKSFCEKHMELNHENLYSGVFWSLKNKKTQNYFNYMTMS